MKYSLRSMMIVVTLLCIGFGVLARIDYLRRGAEFHEREALRYRENAMAFGDTPDITYLLADDLHSKWARRYRHAMYRPWTIVNETTLDRP